MIRREALSRDAGPMGEAAGMRGGLGSGGSRMASESLIRARVWVTGRVQGVAYRAFAQQAAGRKRFGRREILDVPADIGAHSRPPGVVACELDHPRVDIIGIESNNPKPP